MDTLRESVLKKIKDNRVKFIRLQFTDILGVLKAVTVTEDQMDKVMNGELMFDGSSVDGFVRIEESDMYLKPDLNTFLVLPWQRPNSTGSIARIICDVYDSEEKPFEGCPRQTLKRVLSEASDLGYTAMVGPEPEFFLFEKDQQGKPTLTTNDKAGYFDLPPVDYGEEARQDMVQILRKLGFDIEASHHEVAPGQHEIDFKYADALVTADNIVTFRLAVRIVAQNHGLHATFMPKPVFGECGSGMHLHISLFKDGENIFFDPTREDGLSGICHHFIGGIMKHARALAAVTNPTVNSYKRLVPGYEAPVYIAWSYKNRSPLIRIPARRGIGTRIELRNPDPTCNPYLGLAAILKSGLEGIKNKITPPGPVNENIYEMDLASRLQQGIVSLPSNLLEALEELRNDAVVREALGSHVYKMFMQAKLKEWENYSARVYDWEIDEYLEKF